MFSALWRRKSFLVFSFYSCSAFLLKFMGVILIKSFLTSALPEKLMIEIQIAAAPRWRSSQSRLSRSPLSPPTLSPPCSSQMLPWWTWAMSPDSLPSSTILESVKALTWPIMWSCTTTPMLTLLFHWGRVFTFSWILCFGKAVLCVHLKCTCSRGGWRKTRKICSCSSFLPTPRF